jgi:hypothetical protein
MKIKPKTLKYFDYFEVESEVAQALGKTSLRDFDNEQDFWGEYIVDQIPGNDCYVHLYFGSDEEDADLEPWIAEICKKFREIIGDDEDVIFRISW